MWRVQARDRFLASVIVLHLLPILLLIGGRDGEEGRLLMYTSADSMQAVSASAPLARPPLSSFMTDIKRIWRGNGVAKRGGGVILHT